MRNQLTRFTVADIGVFCYILTTILSVGAVTGIIRTWSFFFTVVTCKYMSLIVRKTVFGVSDLVRLKPVCAIKEDALMLEIWASGSRGIVLTV